MKPAGRRGNPDPRREVVAGDAADPAVAVARLGLRATTPLAEGLAATPAWLQPAAA